MSTATLCDTTCTTDCGSCKGGGATVQSRRAYTSRVAWRYAVDGWTTSHLDLDAGHFLATRPAPRVNHVLHLLLTVVTLGAWAPVWFGLACLATLPRHTRVTVQAQRHADGGWMYVETPASATQRQRAAQR